MLSTRLAYLRKHYKLNQTEMAKKLGMGRTTYAMHEQGNRSPDYSTLNQIADFFDVTTDYLLGRTDDPNQLGSAYYSNEGKLDRQFNFVVENEPASYYSDKDEELSQDFYEMTQEEKAEAIHYIKFQRALRKDKDEDI